MRIAVVAAVGASLVPWAAARAASETPFRTVPGGGPATCLRSAGSGALGVLGPLTSKATAIDLVSAAPSGLADVARASLPPGLGDCPAVAAGPDGTATVAAVPEAADESSELIAAVRDPGAPFGASISLARVHDPESEPAVAVGPRGDVLVAWADRRSHRVSLFASRRPARGSFGAPQVVATWTEPADGGGFSVLAAGIDERGSATLAWTEALPRRGLVPGARLRAAEASADGPFGAPQDLVARGAAPQTIDLATGRAGGALLATDGGGRISLFERDHAGSPFARAGTFGDPAAETASGPSVALAPNGAAVVAWGFDRVNGAAGGIRAVRRASAGSFGAPDLIQPPRLHRDGIASDEIGGNAGSNEPPLDIETGRLRAALDDDGRALVVYPYPVHAAGGDELTSALAAVGSAADGLAAAEALGSPCRDVENVAALTLPNDGPAAAFTDNQMLRRPGGLDVPERAGRVHLALPGLPPAAGPPPPNVSLSLRAPHRRPRFGEPVTATVKCDGACDVRVFVPDTRGSPRALGTATLDHAGRRHVVVQPRPEDDVAPRHGTRTRVVAHGCAPGGREFSSSAVVVHLRRPPPPPSPAPLGLRARRRGRQVVVSWHTRRAETQAAFAVIGLDRSDVPIATGIVDARGARTYRTVLREPAHRRIARVRVIGNSLEPPFLQRSAEVGVR